jgi:hypothetical protein
LNNVLQKGMPYYHDDGTQLNPDLIPKPSLCLACAKDQVPDEMEQMLSNLNRLDQQGEEEFICFAYVPKSAPSLGGAPDQKGS